MYLPIQTAHLRYRFDDFEVDLRAGELRKDGQPLPLQDVPLRFLIALLERPGTLCSRQQLREAIWPADVHLDFDAALRTAAHKVRQALGDDPGSPRYIETLAGRGFRFLGSVTAETTGSARTHRFPVWITAATLAGIAAVALVAWGLRSRMALAPIRSIAVLPLENLGNDPEQEYFADGMTDAITTELGRIPGFDKVISWQSMKGYRKTNKSLGAIARELDVQALVQGTVQREGAQVRIAARLFRANPEKQVWAWSYDRDARDVLSMQAEVAREIAREVQGSLAGPSPSPPPPPVSPEAYDFYLRGVQHMQRSLDRVSLLAATRMFEQAVALEPGFALAHVRLSHAQMTLWFYHYDRTETRRQAALASARRALQLDPGGAAGHLAMGRVHYALRDYPKAIEELEAARRTDPSELNAELLLGSVARRQGRWEVALQYYQRAVALSPRQGSWLYFLGHTLAICRRYEEADEWFQRSLQLEPQGRVFAGRATWALRAGRTGLARSTLEEARKAGFSDHFLTLTRYHLELWSGHPDAALAVLATESLQGMDDQSIYLPKELLQAQAFAVAGQADAARRHYDLARRILEEKAKSYPEDDRFLGALGIANAGLGRKREALAAGRSALALPPPRGDVLHELSRREDLACICTMVGETEEALKELDRLLSVPSGLSVHSLRNDPTWAPLRGTQGYRELLRKYGG